MSFKEFQNELSAIGYKLWLKLQRLPKAEPLEIVCFFIIILFIVVNGRLTLLGEMQAGPEFRQQKPLKVDDKVGLQSQNTKTLYMNLTQNMGLETMPTAKQAAFQLLEDVKTQILTDDWALGGLVVMVSFFTIIIVLILFAVIFGCCSTQRNRLSSG